MMGVRSAIKQVMAYRQGVEFWLYDEATSGFDQINKMVSFLYNELQDKNVCAEGLGARFVFSALIDASRDVSRGLVSYKRLEFNMYGVLRGDP